MKKLFVSILMAAMALSMSAADPITWGYYTGNNTNDLDGVGVGSAALYSVGIIVPESQLLKEAKITAINVPIASVTNVKNLVVWVADAKGNYLSTDTVKAGSFKAGFNKIALANPVTITGKLIVGYSFGISSAVTEKDLYPVLCSTEVYGYTGSLLLAFSAYSATGAAPLPSALEDYSDQFGAAGLNFDVEDAINYPDYSFSSLESKNTGALPNTAVNLHVGFQTDGKKAVSDLEIEINVAGKTHTVSQKVDIAAGPFVWTELNVGYTSPAELGEYVVDWAITKVNGEALSTPAKAKASLVVVNRLATRHSVVEEFTGTGCPNCPRGIAGMKALRDTYGDRFIGIAVHQYNNTDAMYNANYANLSLNAAPSCRIDRGAMLDPYFGSSSNELLHILKDFEEANAEFAPVEVELTGCWTSDAKDSVTLKATTTAIAAGDYKIAFVLTADSLYGTTSAWKQTNNTYQAGKTGEPYIDEFLSGGKYGKSSFSYPFDDVMIGSSFVGTSNKAGKIGALAADESATVSYTIALPTKTTIRNAVNASIDKIYGIAIVTDKSGRIANANRVHINSVTGIFSVRNDEPCQKMLINGQLQIRRGDNCYDALGRIMK